MSIITLASRALGGLLFACDTPAPTCGALGRQNETCVTNRAVRRPVGPGPLVAVYA
jgi:hypothetical protein